MDFIIAPLIGEGGKPLYRALADQVRQGAADLPAHGRLPSIRKMARMADVNPSTVVAALDLLEQEGIIYRRAGSGTYVSPLGSGLRVTAGGGAAVSIPAKGQIDFTAGTPSPEYFPVADFKDAFNSVLDRDRGHAFSYPDPQGYLPLRLAIADYLQTTGLAVAAEAVLITSGAQQAISLLSQTLLTPGDVVGVENPTYPGAVQALQAAGAKLLPVSLGPSGLNLKDLARISRARPKLFYAMPTFQNPTGICYSQESRRSLIRLARELDFYILEGDNVSELYYGNTRPRPLWQEAADRVLYIKSFSKVFMPGLRLGFMILPPALLPAVGRAKHAADLGTSGINQRALDLYLRSGSWQKYLVFLRRTYQERAQVLYQALRRHLSNVATYSPLGGGTNAWLTFPQVIQGQNVCDLCGEAGVLVSPGSQFSLPGYELRHSIRLSIAAAFPEQIEAGVSILAQCVEQLL